MIDRVFGKYKEDNTLLCVALNMQMVDALLHEFRQHDKLPIRIVSPDFGHLSPELAAQYGLTHRRPHYFFLFMLDGGTRHVVDLREIDVNTNELLFVLPQQIHELPEGGHGKNYYKLGFDEDCLARLPRQYPFLVNPLNIQKIRFDTASAARLSAIFEMLRALLDNRASDPEIIVAHLNSLLTEINAAYFWAEKPFTDGKLSKYIDFKLYVEKNFMEHPSIPSITEELALNANSLYQIVKQYSGLSPKSFIINRLMLEARRRIYYGQNMSIKELAFDLGFNDPEYFSRLFKKVNGRPISSFVQDSSGS
jgi:AraC family transcriptional activator of pobA